MKRLALYAVAAIVLLAVGASLGKEKPTQDIGVAVTASPTATPTATAGTPYREWLARTAVFDRLGNLFSDVTDAAAANDRPLVVSSLDILAAALDDEVAWLESHEPEECWRDIWDLTHAGMSIQRSAARTLAVYFGPDGSGIDSTKALDDIRASSQMIDQATGMMDGACS